MRLIDAEALMEDMQKTITEQSSTIDWLNLIHRQPIAYDMDKVIENVEEFRDEMKMFGCDGLLSDLIEVVKGGGVDTMCDRIMSAYREGYRKAIDDVVEEINKIGYVPVCVDCITKHQIIEIAELLKEDHMQEAFEKIIEKLKEVGKLEISMHGGRCNGKTLALGYAKGIENAIEIVKQEYEEFNSNQINQLAMMYAKNLVKYGVDVTKIWNTAVQQTYSLNEAYMRGVQDERDRFNKYNNGWIPCSERLPEDGEDVLVWFEYFRYGEYNRLFQTIGISYTFDGKFSDFVNGSSGWDQLRFIAWQPLPQPYKIN